MSPETKQLIKDLFIAYAELNVDQELEDRAVCTSCFAFSGLDQETQQWSKLKHADDCAVTVMRARVRKAVEENK